MNSQKVIELYKQDKTLRQIALEVFGVWGIDRVIRILQADPDSGYQPHRRRGRRRTYFYDENFFSSIDTEEKAYLFGFIAADGWIKYMNGNPMAVCLEIKATDREILDQWRNLMGDKAPPVRERQCDYSPKARIVFHSVKMVRDLERLGLGQNKTYNLNDITPMIPKQLRRHFFRGVFDGDGCPVCERYRLRISFRGTLPFLQGLQRIAPEPMIITHTEKWPTLYTTTHRAGIRLTFWMYEDATIFLKRKYDKCRSGYVLRRA